MQRINNIFSFYFHLIKYYFDQFSNIMGINLASYRNAFGSYGMLSGTPRPITQERRKIWMNKVVKETSTTYKIITETVNFEKYFPACHSAYWSIFLIIFVDQK